MLPPYIIVMKTVAALFPFNTLAPETAQDFLRTGEHHTWQTGEVVFREGDPCNGMHVVVDGVIQGYRTGPDGREQIIHLLRAGSILAVAPLIDDAPYPISTRALTRSETFFIGRKEFDRLFREYNDFARAILRDLATRHRTTLELLDTIALKPVHARVATLLINAAKRNSAGYDNGQFEFMLTQEQLASAIATTREGVARSLARMRKDGLIEQRASSIRIVDWNRLLLAADTVTDAAALHVPPLGVASQELE